jgi:hypothetical protein
MKPSESAPLLTNQPSGKHCTPGAVTDEGRSQSLSLPLPTFRMQEW